MTSTPFRLVLPVDFGPRGLHLCDTFVIELEPGVVPEQGFRFNGWKVVRILDNHSHYVNGLSFVMTRVCTGTLVKQHTLEIIDILRRRLARRVQKLVHVQDRRIGYVVLALLAFVRRNIENKTE